MYRQVELPSWLKQFLSVCRTRRSRRQQRRIREFSLPSLEARLVLSTFPWAPEQNHSISLVREQFAGTFYVDAIISGTNNFQIGYTDALGATYTDVQVDAQNSNETLVLNLSNGPLSQNYSNPTFGTNDVYVGNITFQSLSANHSGSGNTLVISDKANDNDIFKITRDSTGPLPITTITIHDPTANLDTTVQYDTTVSTATFALTGAHQINVDSGESLTWNSISFPASYNGQNSLNQNLSFTVGSGGQLSFGQSASIASLEIQAGGLAAVLDSPALSSRKVLTAQNVLIDSSGSSPLGKLDLANNELDVQYTNPNDPVGIIRNYLAKGMGTGGKFGTGNWSSNGIDSSAAANHYPAAAWLSGHFWRCPAGL